MLEKEKSQEIPVDLQKEAKKIEMDKSEEIGVIVKMKVQIKANEEADKPKYFFIVVAFIFCITLIHNISYVLFT